MAWLRFLTLASFRRLNPQWAITLHEPSKQCVAKSYYETDDLDYTGKNYLDQLDELGIRLEQWNPPRANLAPAHACDLFEWQLLAETGGWYSDTDVIYTRPMPEIEPEVTAVFCLEKEEMAIGLFGSTGPNPMFRDIYRQALNGLKCETYQSVGVHAVYRTVRLWPMTTPDVSGTRSLAALRKQYPRQLISTLPTETIYLHTWQEANLLYKKDVPLPEKAIGVHWFGGLYKSHRAVRYWTPEWQGTIPCTMARLARAESLHAISR